MNSHAELRASDQDGGGHESGESTEPSWKSLFNFTTASHVPTLTIAMSFSVLSGTIVPISSYLLGRIFDIFTKYAVGKISGETMTNDISAICLYFLALGCGAWLSHGVFFASWVGFGELQAKHAREQLYKAMLQKEMEWYDTRCSGVNTLIPRSQAQIRDLQLATSQPLGSALQIIVTFFSAMGLALYMAWDLTLITMASLPFAIITVTFVSARMQPAIEKQATSMDFASKTANNAVSNIEVVKTYNGQDLEVARYKNYIRTGAKHYLGVAFGNGLQIACVRTLVLTMFVQGFWYGNHVTETGKRSSGQVLTAFWAAMMATQSLESILPQTIVLEKGRSAGAVLRALLINIEKGKQINEAIGGKRPEFCEGDITLTQVSFSYPTRREQHALSDASFFFPADETTFVLGKSGSGKSTFSNLLLRFYKPDSGSITLDEESLDDIHINWLRNNITLVQQDTILFDETLLTNIAFGRNDFQNIDGEDLEAAIRLADLHDTLKEMPEGLNTLICNGGKSLSGGQRQRVAIARARLRDTAVLILDEATSALDQASKVKVMAAIRQWRRGKTTIVITHDISQVEMDDFVYILDQGVVVEEGYKRLLESKPNGNFAKFQEASNSATTTEVRHSSLMPLGSPPEKTSLASDTKPGFPQDEEPLVPDANYVDSANAMRQARRRSQVLSLISGSTLGRVATRQTSVYLYPSLATLIDSPVSSLSTSSIDSFSQKGQHQDQKSSQSTPVSPISSASISWSAKKGGAQDVGGIDLELNELGVDRHRHNSQSPPLLSLVKIFKTVWPALSMSGRVTLILGIAASVAHGAATPVFSWVFAHLLKVFVYTGPDRSAMALKWSMAVLGAALGDGISSFFMHYFLEKAGQEWVDALREEAMLRVLEQPKEWYDERSHSLQEVVSCLDRSAEEMRNLLGRFAAMIMIVTIILLTTCVWCMTVSWKVTLLGIGIAPFLYAVTRGFDKVSSIWEGRTNAAGEAAATVFSESIGTIRTIRSLTLEAFFHRKFAESALQAAKVGAKRALIAGLFFGLTEAMLQWAPALIFWFGSKLAFKKQVTVESLLEDVTMILFAVGAVSSMLGLVPQISSAQQLASQVLHFTRLPLRQSHEHIGRIRVDELPGTISFNNVSFRYPTRPQQLALSSISLTIPLQTSTALVGASGSGKSTVIALLLGLYAVEEKSSMTTALSPSYSNKGLITIGEYKLTSLHLPTLRSLIGYVPQQSVLFPGTISENVTYGLAPNAEECSESAVTLACELVGLHSFVTSLASGYATLVGEGGTTLSGGQMQRLSLARALVRQPELLILDEPTSALDPESAAWIMGMLKRLVNAGLTVLVITHHEEMMKAMGRVIVMQSGQVSEEGTWENLMANNKGALRRLLALGDTSMHE